MNFFVRAVNNPELIVNALTIYKNPEDDINSELVQLVYHGNLSYVDLQYMTYSDRMFWIREIGNIIKQNNSNNNDEFKGFS